MRNGAGGGKTGVQKWLVSPCSPSLRWNGLLCSQTSASRLTEAAPPAALADLELTMLAHATGRSFRSSRSMDSTESASCLDRAERMLRVRVCHRRAAEPSCVCTMLTACAQLHVPAT